MSAPERVEVLHVIGSLVAGGAERFVVDLLCELRNHGVPVGLAVLSNGADAVGEDMRARLQRAGIPLCIGPTFRVGARSALWYVRVLAQWDPRIVHLHTENTELAHYLAQLVWRGSTAIVRTVHNTQLSQQWLHQRAMARNRAALSIACGPAVMERFATQMRGRLIAIDNGIDFHWPIRTAERKTQQRVALGWAPEAFHVVHVGGLRGATVASAGKAHDVLIDAWREARMGERGAHLHLLGDGNLRPELVRRAAGDASIVFHGIQSEVWRWLLAADCFVMPSRFEGLPIAAIEALGTGLPCIFSDIQPLRRLAGTSIQFVRTEDRTDLAGHMVEAMAQSPFFAPEEIQRVRAAYGISGTALRYREAYQALGYAAAANARPAVAAP